MFYDKTNVIALRKLLLINLLIFLIFFTLNYNNPISALEELKATGIIVSAFRYRDFDFSVGMEIETILKKKHS